MIELDVLQYKKIIGLGCSTFGGSTSHKTALKSLEYAFDKGIVYYDVARSYGYGEAESIVGNFARTKRSKIIISSKFGILPPPQFPFQKVVINVLRELSKYIPNTSSSIKHISKRSLNKVIFTPDLVIKSLNQSLSKLKTDYIDLFLFHESSYNDLLNDDIKYVLEKEIEKGKIRMWGANINDKFELKKAIKRSKLTKIAQFPYGFDDIYIEAINRNNSINIIYSVLNILTNYHNTSNSNILKKVKERHKNINFIDTAAELIIFLAFQELKSGVMLLSMTKDSHIDRNLLIAEAATLSKEINYDLKSSFINFLNYNSCYSSHL